MHLYLFHIRYKYSEYDINVIQMYSPSMKKTSHRRFEAQSKFVMDSVIICIQSGKVITDGCGDAF